MRRILGNVCAALVVASASFTSATAHADVDVQQLLGTWECEGPGQTHPMKPPIMWFGFGASNESIGVDGFSRSVYGPAAVTGTGGGSMRIAVKDGEALTVSDIKDNGRKATMTLHRDSGAGYQCSRLPRLN